MEDIMESDEEKENERLWTTVSSPRKLRGSKQTNSNDTQLQPSRRQEATQRLIISSPITPAPIQLQLQLDTSSNNNLSNNNQIKPSPIILHESSLKQTLQTASWNTVVSMATLSTTQKNALATGNPSLTLNLTPSTAKVLDISPHTKDV
ncbi:hypothetical protein K0M31_012870 [Melipona bicolor]|uniref:Uncharacterized protein n=1 Tax=Melipona bicolor TaxID=60889 RepID=A0AA40KH48_9HYME|nr:hypothetical protein K0M31_012870 [Melipona bicolor]